VKNIARRAAWALGLLLFAAVTAASAEDARSAAVGATIKEGSLNIGSRTWKLPPGPRPMINVQVVKYEGGEFFRASSWIDPAVFGLKGEEMSALTAAPEPLLQWARAYRAVVVKAMGSTSGTFTVPPLPGR